MARARACDNAPAAEDQYSAERPTAPQQRQPAEARPTAAPQETTEQIDSHCNHHDPDEPLDQTIRIAGRHTAGMLVRHKAQFDTNRHIGGRPRSER